MQAIQSRDTVIRKWMAQDRSELAITFRVGAAGLPSKRRRPMRRMSALRPGRQFDASKLAEFGEGLGNRSGSGRRLSVRAENIANSSGRSRDALHIESGSWGSAGSEMTRAPKFQ